MLVSPREKRMLILTYTDWWLRIIYKSKKVWDMGVLCTIVRGVPCGACVGGGGRGVETFEVMSLLLSSSSPSSLLLLVLTLAQWPKYSPSSQTSTRSCCEILKVIAVVVVAFAGCHSSSSPKLSPSSQTRHKRYIVLDSILGENSNLVLDRHAKQWHSSCAVVVFFFFAVFLSFYLLVCSFVYVFVRFLRSIIFILFCFSLFYFFLRPCRVVSCFGITCARAADDRGQLKLVQLVLMCTSNSDKDIASIPLYFWYRFCRVRYHTDIVVSQL